MEMGHARREPAGARALSTAKSGRTRESTPSPDTARESSGAGSPAESAIRFQLDDAIASISRWLPTQSPIKDFIHHNTLHALENRPFHEAIAIASRIYGARSYLPLADYQVRYRKGRIHDFALVRAIAQVEPESAERERLREELFENDHQAHYPPPSLALQGMRQTWLTHIELNLDAWVHPVLFRLISNYLDQGISRWSIARPDESLWDCLGRLVDGSFVPLFPFADPEARAVIAGLGLDRGLPSLAALYLAGLSGIGYGLRQLLERFAAQGMAIETLVASGGAAQSALACQMLADSTGLPVALPEVPEPVLLGAAMLGAIASGCHADAGSAMAAMSGPARLFQPAKGDLAALHHRRFAGFTALQEVARGMRQV